MVTTFTFLLLGTIVGDSAISELVHQHLQMEFNNIKSRSIEQRYNVLINQTQYKDIMQFVNQEEGLETPTWNCVGKEELGDKLLEPTPKQNRWKINKSKRRIFCNSSSV